MKVQTSKTIQKQVNKRQGHRIAKIAAAFLPAEEFAPGEYPSPEDAARMAADAHADGVKLGMRLATQLIKRAAATPDLLTSQLGVYVATQETDYGEDRFYFVATPAGICLRLGIIPATEK